MNKKYLGFGLALAVCLALAYLLAYGALSALSVGDENAANDKTPGNKTELPGVVMDGEAHFINIQNKAIGTALLQEGPSGVLIMLDLKNLPAGEHAIHIHETGTCTPVEIYGPAEGKDYFRNAGSHLNPGNREHGLLNAEGPHAGDMPNVHVGSDGILQANLFNDRITLKDGNRAGLAYLFDEDGSALIIHSGADDYQTSPTGDAGDRIACAVIEKSE